MPGLSINGASMTAASPLLSPGDAPKGAGAEHAHSKNELNIINGCYIPCLLNILGAVLFLRIGFSVGMMGMLGTLGIFLFSEGVAYLTICSFSAICTNGMMAGGGSYYMISRNLGPAFGASSGLLLWFTYTITVTFNVVAFTETFMSTYLPAYPGVWAARLCSSITLFVLFLIAFKGAATFAKVNYFIFVGLVISLAASIGSVMNPYHAGKELREVTYAGQAYQGHFYPFAWHARCPGREHVWRNTTEWANSSNVSASNATHGQGACVLSSSSACHVEALVQEECWYGIKTTLWPDPVVSEQCGDALCDLGAVFGIVFPAVTGMMEGLNLSGDLKDPGYAIPWGTIAAVTTAFFFYVMLIIGQSATMTKDALHYNMFVMQDACVSPYFVVLGVATACLSTSLGSMFGSARILQAIAADGCVPQLAYFAKGTAQGNEPRRAVCLTWFIAQGAIFIGGLDAIGPVLTNFYLITYALTNLACFLLVVAKVPNFRPVWRWYSWHASLFATIVVTAAMFYLDVLFAFVTVLIVLVFFLYVDKTSPPKDDWGDIFQALRFRTARSCLLALSTQPKVTKFWRPSLLFLCGEWVGAPPGQHGDGALLHSVMAPCDRALLHFCDALKSGGLFAVGRVLALQEKEGGPAEHVDVDAHMRTARTELRAALQHEGVLAFASVAAAPSVGCAARNLIANAGLPEAMEAGILALSLSSAPQWGEADFHASVLSGMAGRKVVLVGSNFDAGLEAREVVAGMEQTARVDVWAVAPAGEQDVGMHAMIQLAHVLVDSARRKHNKALTLRVKAVTGLFNPKRLQEICVKIRVKAETTTEGDHFEQRGGGAGRPSRRCEQLNDAIAGESAGAAVTFVNMPPPPPAAAAPALVHAWVQDLYALSKASHSMSSPVVLVGLAPDSTLLTTQDI